MRSTSVVGVLELQPRQSFQQHMPCTHCHFSKSQQSTDDCNKNGCADCWVRKQGYRVIAADAPAVWNHLEWVSSFEKFLDALGVHQV